MHLTVRRTARLTALVAGALALPVGAAAARPTLPRPAPVRSAPPAPAPPPLLSGCPADGALSQPFTRWGDVNEYRLVPGGDFTAGAPGWTLAGGATVVPGGDPFGLTPDSTAGSLSLPAGASAESPFTCVDSSQPTFRFLGLDASGAGDTTVDVAVVYPGLLGPVTIPVGQLSPTGEWAPSPAYQNGAAIAGLLHGGTAEMALRFTAVSGTAQLDDIFVDPRLGWT